MIVKDVHADQYQAMRSKESECPGINDLKIFFGGGVLEIKLRGT